MWQFEFDGHASRSLRALVAVALVAMAWPFAAAAATGNRIATVDTATLDRLAQIIDGQDPRISLPRLGRQECMFSESGRTFYVRQARTLVDRSV